MSELPKVDVTDYLYQKLSYCIVFDVDIKAKLEQFSCYFEMPHF